MAPKAVSIRPTAGVAFITADLGQHDGGSWYGEAADVIRPRSRREPPPLPAISRRAPAACRGRRAGPRRNDPAEDGRTRSADVGAAAVGSSHQVTKGRAQRLRFRAGLPANRAAGAFR